jgi:glycosyltransferase involved in cell wall biosynthesis
VHRPALSAVVPAFNEAAGIVPAVEAIAASLEALDRSWEVLVVDNASPDGTARRIAEATAGDDRFRLLVNDSNRGKGFSMRRGLLAARGELRLHCDADCGPSLVSLPALLDAVERGADVAVGSRLAAGAQIARRQPLRRRIVGRTYVDLCRLVLGEPTHDLFCGFKLWRDSAAEAVFRHTRIDGWAFDAEALALARALGLRIEEVGIAWTDRRGSRLSMTRTLLPAVVELARARRHVRSAAHAAPAAVEAPDAAG